MQIEITEPLLLPSCMTSCQPCRDKTPVLFQGGGDVFKQGLTCLQIARLFLRHNSSSSASMDQETKLVFPQREDLLRVPKQWAEDGGQRQQRSAHYPLDGYTKNRQKVGKRDKTRKVKLVSAFSSLPISY